jgi:general secretion pathway protein N
MQALKKWTLSGIATGVLFALIAYAPATWLARSIAQLSGGQVLLQAPRGTIWDGSAELVLAGGEGSRGAVSLPSRLHWQIRAAWLGLDARLDSSCCAPPASPVLFGVRTGTPTHLLGVVWQLHTPGFELPALLLSGLGSPWNTLQLMGELTVSSDQLTGRWSRIEGMTDLSGRASLQANNVATALSTVRPLGSYRLSTTGAAFKLETLGSAPRGAALLLSGTGQIEQGRASFSGEAMAAQGFEEALSNLLHIVGQWQPSTDGRSRSILKL